MSILKTRTNQDGCCRKGFPDVHGYYEAESRTDNEIKEGIIDV